jgi:hypothetical protein
MKYPIITRIVPALLLATMPALAANEAPKKEIRKEIVIRHGGDGGPQPLNQEMEKEKVAFLGVETMPVGRTVAAQLGLPRDTGLVVRRVSDGSPAAELLQEHDILTKLDDQILIDMHQLSVLVRSRKAGDEVKLTFMRAGKEMTARAKLGEREVPKLAGDLPMSGSFHFGPGTEGFFQRGTGAGFPELAGPEAGDVMRLIGRDRMRWFAAPRVHVFKHAGGKGSTILDLPAGNFSYSDEQGSIDVSNLEGKREITVKDAKGAVTFQGPLNTPEDHKKLPPEVMARLEAIGGADMDDDSGELEVETKMLPPATKTRRALPPGAAPEPGMRTL